MLVVDRTKGSELVLTFVGACDSNNAREAPDISCAEDTAKAGKDQAKREREILLAIAIRCADVITYSIARFLKNNVVMVEKNVFVLFSKYNLFVERYNKTLISINALIPIGKCIHVYISHMLSCTPSHVQCAKINYFLACLSFTVRLSDTPPYYIT